MLSHSNSRGILVYQYVSSSPLTLMVGALFPFSFIVILKYNVGLL